MQLNFLQESQIQFLRKKKYILNDETPEQRYQEIVDRVKYHEDKYNYPEGLAERISYYLQENILSPSTPTLANFGRKNTKALPVSCYIVGVGDSIRSIYSSNLETAMMSKLGGGVGLDFSKISEVDTEVAEGFFSNSKLDWIESIVDTTQKVSQNSQRRGYGVPFLSILDKEFDLLMSKVNKKNNDDEAVLTGNNVGILIPSGFMAEMLAGNEEYQTRWKKLLIERKESGLSYIVFEENCNKNTSPVYKNLGLSPYQSNICCVSGDTKILTDKGNLEIENLLGQTVKIWSGEVFMEVEILQTGKEELLYRVILEDGRFLDCTENHRWLVRGPITPLEKKTHELTIEDFSIAYFNSDNELVDSSKIKSIELLEGRHNTFCFNEPTYGRGVFNDIITNQCEILTPYFHDKSFACVLGALNLNHWDKIKANPQIIKDCIYYLDILTQDFIDRTEGIAGMDRTRRSAIEKRDLGLGTLGFHELLQSKNIIFGSLESKFLNEEIYSTIQEHAIEASEYLADLFGSCKLCTEAGVNRRNVSLMAIAPNKSTSFFCNATSPGIEPFMSNIFVKSLAGIQYSFKNPHLKTLLKELNKDDFQTWLSISQNLGSVQHLDFLSEHQKKVFKTFNEISPKDIIDLAADRQKYIDMGQSLNLMNRPNYTLKDIHKMTLYAYERGIKTLYYFYPQTHAFLEKEGESWDTCESCAD